MDVTFEFDSIFMFVMAMMQVCFAVVGLVTVFRHLLEKTTKYMHIQTGNLYTYKNHCRIKIGDTWQDGTIYTTAKGNKHELFVRTKEQFMKKFNYIEGPNEL
jgi:hypothetical protein